MDKELVDRLLALYDYLRKIGSVRSQSDFCDKIGIGTSMFTEIKKGRSGITREKLQNITGEFLGYKDWLFTGSGNMPKADDTFIEGDNNSVMNINAGGDVKGNKVNQPTNVEMFMAEIAAQRKLTEKAQEQVSTAQEQMGVLLELLKK